MFIIVLMQFDQQFSSSQNELHTLQIRFLLNTEKHISIEQHPFPPFPSPGGSCSGPPVPPTTFLARTSEHRWPVRTKPGNTDIKLFTSSRIERPNVASTNRTMAPLYHTTAAVRVASTESEQNDISNVRHVVLWMIDRKFRCCYR